jgi:hypothetical protein
MGFKPRTPLNEELIELVRVDIGPRAEVVEQRMFGGIAFLFDGKMSCGVVGSDLMVRLSPGEAATEIDSEPAARPMDFTGRPLRGFLFLSETGWRNSRVRRPLVERSVDYAQSLPRKKR